MIKIDGKTAVSISAMGENHAYQYALVIRPDTMEVLGQDCYYYDECGHAVFLMNGSTAADMRNRTILSYCPICFWKNCMAAWKGIPAG